MSVEAISKASKVSGLPSTTKFVLIALANYANDENEAWPKQETIADWTSLRRETVQRHLADLERLGYIRIRARYREDGSQTSNAYDLLFMAEGFTPGVIVSHARCDSDAPPPVSDSHTRCERRSHPPMSDDHTLNHQLTIRRTVNGTIKRDPRARDGSMLPFPNHLTPEEIEILPPTPEAQVPQTSVGTSLSLPALPKPPSQRNSDLPPGGPAARRFELGASAPEPGASAREGGPAARLRWWAETYNVDKPAAWIPCHGVTKDRSRHIDKFVGEHGEARAREMFVAALAYIRTNAWWNTKDIRFDSLWKDNRIEQWAEAHAEQARSPWGQMSASDRRVAEGYQHALAALGGLS